MALPTAADLKSYLRIEQDVEDTLLTALLARAVAMLEGWVDTPITARAYTYIDRCHGERAPRALVLPRRPVSVTQVVDAEGAVVDPLTYSVDADAGMIWGVSGTRFPVAPYTITASAGMSLWSDYAQREPVLAEMVLDLAADLYQRRTPGAASETGAGTSVTWDVSRETIARVQKSIRALKLGVAL